MSSEFQTPQDAEDAFYDAFERGDADAMMEVWDECAEIACAHPMGPTLQGRNAIRDSWAQIFAAGVRLEVLVYHKQWFEGSDLAVHVVEEELRTQVPGQRSSRILATNVYRPTASGWRMLLHHASPSPPPMHMGMTSSGAADPPPGLRH